MEQVLCEHDFKHIHGKHICIRECRVCEYSEPDCEFDCLSLHDQLIAVEYLREQ
jgi:hypothetical protein